jgi:hypothetical protein
LAEGTAVGAELGVLVMQTLSKLQIPLA